MRKRNWCICGAKNPKGAKFCCQCGLQIRPQIKFKGLGYSIFARPKGSDVPYQMITAEQPHRTLGRLLSAVSEFASLESAKHELIVGKFGAKDIDLATETIRLRAWRSLLSGHKLGPIKGARTIKVANLP